MLRSWLGCIAGAAANTFSVYDVSTEEGHVKCTAPISLKIAGDSIPLALEVVLDQLDGLYAPFLLTRSSLPLPAVEKACTHQLWKYSACRKALHSYDTFEAPVLQQRDLRYQLMDGPVVLWTEADKLHIQTSARHLALNLRTYSQLLPTWSLIVTAFWVFGHPRDDDMALVFVQTEGCSCLGAAATEREWLCLEAKINGLGAELVPANRFVPSDYGLMASCIALHRGHVMERTTGSVVARHLFIVGTSFKQVVVFQDGQPLYVVPVQLVPTVVAVSEVLGGEIAVVTLDEGHNVYVHMTKPKNKMERCTMWNGASDILIGDFTACGHNQLLVISKNRDGKPELENCRLHDLSNLPSSSEMQQRMEDVPQKASTSSFVEAFRALDLRRKIGELYLCDLEKEFQNKTELMEQGLNFLRSLQTATYLNTAPPPIPPDPTLVTLLPGKLSESATTGDHCTLGFPADRVASHPSLPTHTITLIKQWQRIVDHQWAVGVVIQSHRPLPNVSVTLVRLGGKGGVTARQTCSSKVVWLEEGKPVIAAAPKAKRPRRDTPDGETKGELWKVCVVTICGEVPPVERGKSLASIVCSWNGREDAGSMILGTVTFCIDDLVTAALACDKRCLWLWQGNHSLTVEQGDFSDKHMQDLACLLSAATIEKITVTSIHTSLSCLPAMLRARLPSHVPVLPTAGHGDDVTPPSPTCGGGMGGLTDVVVHVTVKPSATLSILHKTASQLSLVMSLLRHVLPEDMTLTSFCEDEASLISTALCCLEDELLSLDNQAPDPGPTLVECCTKSDHAISRLLLQNHTNMM